jgi:hypothetical protein
LHKTQVDDIVRQHDIFQEPRLDALEGCLLHVPVRHRHPNFWRIASRLTSQRNHHGRARCRFLGALKSGKGRRVWRDRHQSPEPSDAFFLRATLTGMNNVAKDGVQRIRGAILDLRRRQINALVKLQGLRLSRHGGWENKA